VDGDTPLKSILFRIPTVCCYDQTIVDCVDEKEEEEEEKNRPYSLLQLMASYAAEAATTRKPSKQKKR